MHKSTEYVVQSLELHLFFARIMKEHALFLKAGFTPVDEAFAKEAEFFKNEFENVLSCAVTHGDGIITCDSLSAGDFFTEFTLVAEEQTERFTGIAICKNITVREQNLRNDSCLQINDELCKKINRLNQLALRLLNGLICLKEKTLNNVLKCNMFTMNYPLLIEHIIREAKLYQSYLRCLEMKGRIDRRSERQTEMFWNQIMMEHALFIRGLLDPSEDELIDMADSFAKDYRRLLSTCHEAQDNMIKDSKSDVLIQTKKFRDFKAAEAKGIQECKIKSVILPLLVDHVLREANHYIKILSE